jgi:hypothetical protein
VGNEKEKKSEAQERADFTDTVGVGLCKYTLDKGLMGVAEGGGTAVKEIARAKIGLMLR